RHDKPWNVEVRFEVRSGHREGWLSDWPAIAPLKLEVRESAGIRDSLSDEWMYSFKLKIPIRRHPVQASRGEKFRIDATVFDKQTGTPFGQPKTLEWDEEIRDRLGKFNSFAVTAPRRFGKSTLVEYLRSKLQEQKFVACVKNCLTTEYFPAN